MAYTKKADGGSHCRTAACLSFFRFFLTDTPASGGRCAPRTAQFVQQPQRAGAGGGVVSAGLLTVHHALIGPLNDHVRQIAGGAVGEGLGPDAHFCHQLCRGALALTLGPAGRHGRVGLLVDAPVLLLLGQQAGLQLPIVGHVDQLIQTVFAHLGVAHDLVEHGLIVVVAVVLVRFCVHSYKKPPLETD